MYNYKFRTVPSKLKFHDFYQSREKKVRPYLYYKLVQFKKIKVFGKRGLSYGIYNVLVLGHLVNNITISV